MPDPTGQTEDRHSCLPPPASLRLPDEEAIDWGDGTVWFVSWLDDHDAYHAERWYDPDQFDADDADAIARLRDCPEPEEGVFASLDVVEAAMGEALGADVRARLQREAAANPSSCRREHGRPRAGTDRGARKSTPGRLQDMPATSVDHGSPLNL